MAKELAEDQWILPRILMQIPVPWVFVLAYLAGVGLEAVFFHSHYFLNVPFMSGAGAVVFLVGAVLAAWGWLIFRNAKTTRVPGETSIAMVNYGPYRFTRNPMYVGLFITYLGEAGVLRQLFPVLLLPLVFIYLNWVVIPVEEGKLLQTFGARYEEYQARVGRWL